MVCLLEQSGSLLSSMTTDGHVVSNDMSSDLESHVLRFIILQTECAGVALVTQVACSMLAVVGVLVDVACGCHGVLVDVACG
jgi:hypothetical protein